MRISEKRKWYYLYGNTIRTEIVLGGIIGLSLIGFALLDYFLSRNGESTTEDAIIVCSCILIPVCLILIILAREKMGVRLFAKCWFDEIGIHCRYVLWGSFLVKWEEIHTYGTFNSRAGHISLDLVFLSKDPHKPYDKKKLFEISKENLIIEYRPDIWPEFIKFMPSDMKRYLGESRISGRDCYVKR